MAVSDPAALALPAFADVAVSILVPAQTIHQISVHEFADQTSYQVTGNQVGKASLTDAKPIYSWPFLKGLDVKVGATSASIVCLGDSITDGALSTRDANSRWPDLLAQRLQANKSTKTLGVLNQGIGGNRVLHEGRGPSALARFDRDVIAQAGVKYLVIMESINDIGVAAGPKNPHDVVTAEDLIQGFGQMAERAHAHGIKVIGATLTPYMGAGILVARRRGDPAGAERVDPNDEVARRSDRLREGDAGPSQSGRVCRLRGLGRSPPPQGRGIQGHGGFDRPQTVWPEQEGEVRHHAAGVG